MERRSNSPRTTPAAAWPADDSEESVAGSGLHQTAIVNLRIGINEVAAISGAPSAPPPWHAGGGTMIAGFQHPDGSPYITMPDIFVNRQPIDPDREPLTLAVDGTPLLIIEVLYDTTSANDLDLVRGKGYSYAQAGVREYLTLDLTGAYLPEQGRGWRLVDGGYQPWQPDPAGRWRSRELPLAFGLEGGQVAVFDTIGRRLLREGEVERTIREHERREAEELARLERRWAEERALREADLTELSRLRRRLAELEGDR